MGWFDWLFKRKKNKIKNNESTLSKVDKNNEIKEKSFLINNAFEDDEILNFDPVVGNEVNEDFQKYKENLMNNNDSFESIKAKKNINNQSPIQNILNNARLKNDESIKQVLEESETQRKLKLIEDYQKGKIKKIDESLYTDINKSINANNYHTRAANMLSDYKPMTIQEELEKRRQLSQQRQDILKKLKENTLLETYNYEKEERLKYRIDQLKNKK